MNSKPTSIEIRGLNPIYTHAADGMNPEATGSIE